MIKRKLKRGAVGVNKIITIIALVVLLILLIFWGRFKKGGGFLVYSL